MKALSIRQPWAHLIVHEGKTIENRSWSTRYRGPVLIHAAKGMTDEEFRDAMKFVDTVFPTESIVKLARRARASNAPRGGIIGRATLVDVVSQSDSPWFFGPFGFVLEDIQPLPFRPCKGALGFFEVDA
jgi:hypothetical protein